MEYNELKPLCYEGLTLQEIANKFSVSRQRVDQKLRTFPDLRLIRNKVSAARIKDKKDTAQYFKTKAYGGMSRKEFFSDITREYQHYRLQQKKSNSKVPFNLTWADLEWPIVCPVLGIPIDYFSEAGRRDEASCSFDRIDNTLGYVKGNVRVISWRANRIKNDGTAEEHRKIAEYIDKYTT